MDTLFHWDQVIRSRQLGGRHFDWVHWDLLQRNAREWGSREAYVDTFHGLEPARRRRRTWAEAFDDVNAIIAHFLARRIPRGSVLVSQLPNCLESVYLDMVTSKLSMKHAGLNVDLGRRETLGALRQLQPRVAVIVSAWHGRDFLAWYREARAEMPDLEILLVPQWQEAVPDDVESFGAYLDRAILREYPVADWGPALRTDPLAVHELLPTGGTTGVPKISQHAAIDWFHVHSVTLAERAGHTPYDTRLLFGPLSGGSGRLWGVHTSLYSAGRTIYLTEFDEETVLDLTAAEQVTMWVWNPALITRVVTHPRFPEADLRTLRLVCYSGAPLSGDILDRLLQIGVTPFNVYGTSEVGACMAPILPGIRRDLLLDGAGVPLEGFDAPVVDAEGRRVGPGEVGEILIWNIHYGYWGDMEASRRAFHEDPADPWPGYHYTGDLGRYDADGYLHVVGRKKDMILRGAQNIFPKEIEDLLSGHPHVRDIAVVGMPDPVLGERVCAFVVPQPGTAPTVADFQQFLAERAVAKFKWPERVELVDALPIGPGGKVQKGVLREAIAAILSREPSPAAEP
ncbi:MAG: class I adenylate-forming enzyme family protein [Firmicutes bacterium]|nr:class I adenylate-forming enzyme family protein [Bacillota bacterium]